MDKPPGKPDIVDLIFDFTCCCPHMRRADWLYETRIQPKIHSRIEVAFRNSQLADQRQVKAEVGD